MDAPHCEVHWKVRVDGPVQLPENCEIVFRMFGVASGVRTEELLVGGQNVVAKKEQHVVAGKSRRKIARPAGAPGRLGLPAKIERGRGHPAQQLGSTISRAVIDDDKLELATSRMLLAGS